MTSILERVRDTAKAVADENNFIKINEGAIDTFLDTLQESEYKDKVSVVVFPLKFDSPEQEINFISLVDLLNFGSGFRHELHHASDRGAYETICFGCISLYLSHGGNIDAQLMKNIGLGDVGSFFNLPLSKEVALQPGLYTYQPSPLKPLAEKIKSVLNETGSILISKGYSKFSDFIMDVTKPHPDAPPRAASLVSALVETFPAFNDKAVFMGKEVFVLKKAQLLAADLYRRFKETLPNRFDFTDIDRLTVFSDNVLPAVLRKYGILELSEELQNHIDKKEEMKNVEWETALRVCAIHACELIVQKSSGSPLLNSMDLDYYLWTKGKDPDFRKAERHYTKDTIFY